MTTHIDTNTW